MLQSRAPRLLMLPSTLHSCIRLSTWHSPYGYWYLQYGYIEG